MRVPVSAGPDSIDPELDMIARGVLHVGRRQPAHGHRHHQRRGLRAARRRLRADPRRHRPLPLRLRASPTPSPRTPCSGSRSGPACRCGPVPSWESSRLWSSVSSSNAFMYRPIAAAPAPRRCSRSSWRHSASASPGENLIRLLFSSASQQLSDGPVDLRTPIHWGPTAFRWLDVWQVVTPSCSCSPWPRCCASRALGRRDQGHAGATPRWPGSSGSTRTAST